MHDRIDLMLLQNLQDELAVAHVTHHQGRIEHGLAEPRIQIVEHHHLLAAGAQLKHGVAADVAGAAGD